MSDTAEQPESEAQQAEPGEGQGSEKQAKSELITMTPKKLEERLERERAKFSDYEDLKAKAQKFEELQEADKSELQKAQDQIASIEQERDNALRDALRFKVASKYGVGDEDADLFLTGSDEDTLVKQAERLSQRNDMQLKQGNHVPDEGKPLTAQEGSDVAFARSFFGAD